MAKSLLCVQKIANSPARPALIGRLTRRVTATTTRNTIVLATRIDNKNIQLTEERSSSARERKISAGSENEPTKVLRPFTSVWEIRLIRPATYLQKEGTYVNSNTYFSNVQHNDNNLYKLLVDQIQNSFQIDVSCKLKAWF